MPAAHAMQDVESDGAYVPAAQASQGVDGSESRSACPASQLLQTVDLAADYWPAEQGTHAVDGSES